MSFVLKIQGAESVNINGPLWMCGVDLKVLVRFIVDKDINHNDKAGLFADNLFQECFGEFAPLFVGDVSILLEERYQLGNGAVEKVMYYRTYIFSGIVRSAYQRIIYVDFSVRSV